MGFNSAFKGLNILLATDCLKLKIFVNALSTAEVI